MRECAMSKFHEIRRPKSGGFVSFSKRRAFVLVLRTLLRFLCRSYKEREKFCASCTMFFVHPAPLASGRQAGSAARAKSRMWMCHATGSSRKNGGGH